MFQIVMVGTQSDDPIWKAVMAGAGRFSREARRVALREVLPTSATPVAQTAELEKILTQPLPSVVCILPVDVKALVHPISTLSARGVHAVLIGSDAPDSRRRLFAGPDEKAIGQAIAETATSVGKGHVTLMAIHDSERDRASALRLEGFVTIVARTKEAKLLRDYDCMGKREKALAFLLNTSERYPNLGAWALLSDWLGDDLPTGRALIHGAARIVAYGARPESLDFVADGRVYAVVTVDWEEIGYQTLHRCHDLLSISVFPKTDYLAPPIVVTRDNVDAHRKKWRDALRGGDRTGQR